MCHRAALVAPGHNTKSQDNLPEIGKKIAYNAHRDGVAERFAAPAVPKTMEVARALLPSDDERLKDLARSLVQAAKPHDAPPLSLLPTVPGLGKRLSLVRRYDIHAIDRCASGQDWVSSCRLVTWATASAGKRLGTSGNTIGHGHLTWAFAEAVPWFLRNHAAGQRDLARFEHTPGKGNALTILAHQLARAV